MISFIKGELLFTDADSICLYANGVGWDVNVPDPIMYFKGKEYSLFCYTHFTQDQTTLWGVNSLEELNFLKKLIGVSGVGPRTAVALITAKGIDAIVSSVETGDVASLKVKGLGEKTIQKIIIELKGKVDLTQPSKTVLSSKVNDILEALIHLGYSKIEIMNYLSLREPTFLDESDERIIIKEFLKQR